ncbi:MAG: hypothetical protein GAK38_01659 [Xylophilus sp.]|nr:MAG: hypothetical protein GAK38_01659 [Xylophilus sp.]
MAPLLVGCDFSSAPSRRKPIVLALGEPCGDGKAVRLTGIETFDTLPAFGAWLAGPRRWVGGFDLPFGLPRELIETLGWPTQWPAWLAHYRALTRAEIRQRFAAFCAARPAGGKFAHRATDGPAGSSPSMKWVNPPVAFMLHAGVPLLVDAGAHLPGLIDGDTGRVALEAYPGLTAREVLGRRSYKADDRACQTPERAAARAGLLAALLSGTADGGRPLRTGLRLEADAARQAALVADAAGDRIDAVLCLLEAGAAWRAHAAGDADYGLPPRRDRLEGWITGA